MGKRNKKPIADAEALSEPSKNEVKEFDRVNHPAHYTQGKYEVIDVIEDGTKNLKGIQAVCVGNVLKYVLRFQYKNGVEDLKKARFYLDKLIVILSTD
jgi:hypothetical protein